MEQLYTTFDWAVLGLVGGTPCLYQRLVQDLELGREVLNRSDGT